MNNIKTIFKLSKPIVITRAFLPDFFYIKKHFNNSFNTTVAYKYLALIFQINTNLKIVYKKT